MELKKILVLGVGAQGSAAAKRLDEDPGVAEIICADYDKKAVDNLVKDMQKAYRWTRTAKKALFALPAAWI